MSDYRFTLVVWLYVAAALLIITALAVRGQRARVAKWLKLIGAVFLLLAWIKGLVVLASFGKTWLAIGLFLAALGVIPLAVVLSLIHGVYNWIPILVWTAAAFALFWAAEHFESLSTQKTGAERRGDNDHV